MLKLSSCLKRVDNMNEIGFEPVFDENSHILILGSFPSVKSRQEGFYYGNPGNRFWRVISFVCNDACPKSIPEKKSFLLRHNIALWDAAQSCEIHGSADTSIKNVSPADIGIILDNSPVNIIYCNGGKAFELYNELLYERAGIKAVKLPSTSPANAAYSLEKLQTIWKDTII